MNIERALKLKIGDNVNYPSDRGDKAGTGKVLSISTNINKNIHGAEYIWIGLDKSNGVWPSNRL